ncbi:MAG: SDR family oxidoreductase [Candidatus Pacebacteria bacterium]|nr:SDR family oxidoreductase [Candidatus Paceibacterota bacterium]
MRLKDKVAIVTGASSGIGKAIADSFVKEGAKVVYSDINNIDNLPEGAIFFKADVSSSEQVKTLISEAVSVFGSLDVMVNNAGIGSQGSILEESDANFAKTIAVNLSGTFYGSREAGKYMKEQGIKGSIINISSILGQVGFQGAISYCASKGGVMQLTKAGALDLAPFNIRINAIAPGFIETEMTKEILKDENFNNLVLSSTPLNRVGSPEEIAKSAVFLASDESSYITGETLFVDGGWRAK